MHIIIGLFIVSAIIYFAFIRNSDDSTELAVRKIARLAVVIAVIIGVLIFLGVSGYFN
jgi:hypothetical protein